MIISLTGFMGCGKSSVGKELAELLSFRFIDLDRYVEHKAGKNIPDIFREDGEERFRALEAEAVRDVIIMSQITGEDLVLALGGGTLSISSVRGFILGNTSCIYLKAELEDCLKWIGERNSRPMLNRSGKEIRELFEERTKLYENAPFCIDVTENGYKETAESIIGKLRLNR